MKGNYFVKLYYITFVMRFVN